MRILNTLLVVAVLVSAFLLYSLEHEQRRGERRIAKLQVELKEERESIRLLEAEWSHLTRPRRLELLARDQLGLAPTVPTQFLTEADLDHLLPMPPAPPPADPAADPIGSMIETVR